MQDLTDRQRELLGFMFDFCAANKRPPGIREIGAGIGVQSNNGVMDHLRYLKLKGHVAQVKAGGRHAWWPVRDLDGASVRWRLTYERTKA